MIKFFINHFKSGSFKRVRFKMFNRKNILKFTTYVCICAFYSRVRKYFFFHFIMKTRGSIWTTWHFQQNCVLSEHQRRSNNNARTTLKVSPSFVCVCVRASNVCVRFHHRIYFVCEWSVGAYFELVLFKVSLTPLFRLYEGIMSW